VFENILGQEASAQIAEDLRNDRLAPSILFRGPRAAGKGTVALELGRILSCERPGKAWVCSCPACRRHRFLYHPDLLALGSRPFSAEIASAAAVFTLLPSDPAVRAFYIRAVRKLVLRFSPILWEDEPKAGKLAPILTAIEGDLDEIIARFEGKGKGEGEGRAASPKDIKWAEKMGKSLGKSTLNLEAEGISGLIPVGQIRRASYWSRLAPQGRRKLLLIENADRMQDASRNALLKILEEPPADTVIVLTTGHSDALLPTVLSRLRPYRFYPRSAGVEKEVLRRVFRSDTARQKAAAPEASITAYMDSFLPVSGEALYPLAAFFAASAAYRGARSLFGSGCSALPAELEVLGKYAAGIAEKAGLERRAKDTGSCVAAVLKAAEDFTVPGLFAQFAAALLAVISGSLRSAPPSPGGAAFADIWREAAADAVLAVGTYNLTPAAVLDRLCTDLTRRMTALYREPPAAH
jgi:DNA polymerase-3 subunit gamma/tau